MILKEVFDSYMAVSGEDRSAAYTDRLMFNAMDAFFGPKAVNDITPVDLTNYLAVKRKERIKRKDQMVPLQPATLNKHTQFLRRLLTHAENLGEPIRVFKWKSFMVVEPEQTTSFLTIPQEHAALTDMDDYIRPIFLFSVLSGVRLSNAIGLKKSMIDWSERLITFRGKSRRPGGKTYLERARPFFIHSWRDLPRLRPVGPWGWAAHQQRLDLMQTTAALLGFEGADIYFDSPDAQFNPPIGGPWWYPAYDFLRQKGLTVTETLNVEPLHHQTII